MAAYCMYVRLQADPVPPDNEPGARLHETAAAEAQRYLVWTDMFMLVLLYTMYIVYSRTVYAVCLKSGEKGTL